ncbi:MULTISPECIES: type IV conjugative transfer system protein TraE [Cysteiniphilum]|uniref:type IV conjugative transfer system protein TraE n=1 Tax=Cysteiniphilum TaxID=2056696 RepID=UPI00177D758D|nr:MULTISPECIES: type IV conjugative transfer system protein TraE [Cysteiniphilum]
MDFSHHKLAQSVGQYVNRWLKWGCILMSLSVLVLSVMLYQALQHQRTILVPPVMAQKMSISMVNPDESYLIQHGLFLLGLKLNISPNNVDQNHRILKTYITSSAYGELNNLLEAEAKTIKKDQISSVFYPADQVVDLRTLKLKISGILEKRVGKRLVSDNKHDFVLEFAYNNGALQIKNVYEVKDSKGAKAK